jgi:hypothetical protein
VFKVFREDVVRCSERQFLWSSGDPTIPKMQLTESRAFRKFCDTIDSLVRVDGAPLRDAELLVLNLETFDVQIVFRHFKAWYPIRN